MEIKVNTDNHITGSDSLSEKYTGELAKKLNFSARKISSEEAEDIGMYYSIKEGLESGLMTEEEKAGFLSSLELKK